MTGDEAPVDISQRVVSAVAEQTGTDWRELPPLDEVVDTDALENLFDRPEAQGSVVFSYADVYVGVRADEVVAVFEDEAPIDHSF